MSHAVPNPTTRSQVAVAFRASPTLHPDYVYWAEHWEKIRDAEIGEIEVKNKRQKYLPKLSSHDESQYQMYLSRAVFFNMTSKTLAALYGTMFRRNPKVTGFDVVDVKASNKFSKEGMSLNLTAKNAVKEVLAVGRYGLLLDASPDGRGNPYVACYTTENILDWEMSDINGAWTLSRVVLREIFYDRKTSAAAFSYSAQYRVLEIEWSDQVGDYVYSQSIYKEQEARGVPALDDAPDDYIVPTVRGKPLNYIPFITIGPLTNSPDIQKPPIMDIVTLNYSHYLSYAQLEHGRFFTANPVYWVQVAGSDTQAEYWVGPDVVWQLGKDEEAGVIEFNGHGLTFLENALTQKEQQIAAIGGRMMPGTSRSAAESDNSLKMKEANENTLLMNLADTIDSGFTQLIQWWADWRNVAQNRIDSMTFEINRDFLLKQIGAREFRAIHSMYAEGIIPLDVVYDFLKKSEIIPDWMDSDEYKALLQDSKQFPHMVDVLAQMKNFPDATAFHEYRLLQESLKRVSTAEVTNKTGEPTAPGVPKQATAAAAFTKQAAGR